MNKQKVQRSLYVVVAFSLALAGVVSSFSSRASAGQVLARSIAMSSSNAGATAVTYHVKFTPATNGTIGGIVVDFCDDTPLIGDTTCSVPTGFTVSASPAIANFTGMGNGWTASQLNTGQVLLISNATPQTVATSTPVEFDVTTVTNPTTDNHSFYARILTYATASAMTTGYTVSGTTRATNPGGVDNGGVALSTAKVINVTARVMETLSFCVYKAACGDDPSVILGHGPNNVLDSSTIDTNTAKFSISTNAQNGAIIRLKGDTLKAGANDIDAAGTPAFSFIAGTEKFGLKLTTAGTNVTGAAPYNAAGANDYALDTNSTDGSMSVFGDVFANLSGPVNNSVSTLTFAGTASSTTPAGIYTAAHQLAIAGTF